MGRVFSPLDEELGLGASTLTPFVQESLVRLGTWMSFARAATELGHHAHVTVSASTARRQTEAAGATYEALQTAAETRITRDLPAPPAGPAVQLLSADGAQVPLVGGEWAEAKTVAIGTVVQQPPRTRREREQPTHTQDLSYFSRLTDHETFTRLATVETHRRGTETAGVVCAVSDGALWIQDFVDTHRPDAVRILDWAHALEYLGAVATAVYGSDTPAARAWLGGQRRLLLEGDPATVVGGLGTLEADLQRVVAGAPEALAWTVVAAGDAPPYRGVLGQALAAPALVVVQRGYTYLQARVGHLQYATFRAAGYPIGSGSVESANKLLVEARLKGAGRRWARGHVNPLLAVRTLAFNDRWAEAWPQIRTQQRQHAQTRSAQRRIARRQGRAAVQDSAPPPAPTPPAPQRAPAPARRRRPYKPAPDHPWRRPSGPPRCA